MRRLRAAAHHHPPSRKSPHHSWDALAPTKLQVDAILATIGIPETDGEAYVQHRRQTIEAGLPNEAEGFYTDHLPIGALLVPVSVGGHNMDITTRESANLEDQEDTITSGDSIHDTDTDNDDTDNDERESDTTSTDKDKSCHEESPPTELPTIMTTNPTPSNHVPHPHRTTKSSGLSGSVRQRRSAYKASTQIRQRHNAVLRIVTEWLVERGATEVLRDQPLRKWKWLLDRTNTMMTKGNHSSKGLSKKSRAPDLCCVLTTSNSQCRRVIVEVTVTNHPDKIPVVRREKMDKYQDVIDLLLAASTTAPPAADDTADGGLLDGKIGSVEKVEPIFVVVMDGSSGQVPPSTLADLQRLATLSSHTDENDDDAATEVARVAELLTNAVTGV